MKKILISLAALVPLFVYAKDLPSQQDIISILNKKKHTEAEKWEKLDNGSMMQKLENGSLSVSEDSLSFFLAVSGNSSDELLLSYAVAGLTCVNVSLDVIGQSKNETVREIMIKNVNSSLKTPGTPAHTLAWGYSFDVTATSINGGVLLLCSIS